MELTEGRRIRLIGVPKYEDKVFSVTEMRHGLAVCEGEEGTLLLPVNDALSFGVLVLREKDEVPAAATATTADSVPETAPEKTPAAPAVRPLPFEEGKEYTGRVIFWQGHWGKIEHPGLQSGLFFHMSMIEDDDLLTVLNAPNQSSPEVSYTIIKNPKRLSGFCAAGVHLVSEDAELPDEDELGDLPEDTDEAEEHPAEPEQGEQE